VPVATRLPSVTTKTKTTKTRTKRRTAVAVVEEVVAVVVVEEEGEEEEKAADTVSVTIAVLVVVAKVFAVAVTVLVSAAVLTPAKCHKGNAIKETARRRRRGSCARRLSHLLRGDGAATWPRCLTAAGERGSA